MLLSEELAAAARKRFISFEEQYTVVIEALEKRTEEFSIALIALYGSVMTGLRPGSDIDILILLSDKFRERGDDLLDLKDAIRDCVEAAKVNEIPLDLHIASARSFVDTSHGYWFKRSVCANNEIMCEDGVTIDRRFIEAIE